MTFFIPSRQIPR